MSVHWHIPGVLRPGGGVQPDQRIGEGEHLLAGVAAERLLSRGRDGVTGCVSPAAEDNDVLSSDDESLLSSIGVMYEGTGVVKQLDKA